MKKILNLLLAACLISFAACSKDQTEDPGNDPEKPGSTVTPNFPAKIARTITLEEGTSFTITPNMDWTISIPSEQEMTRYFKVMINNEELIGYSRNGKDSKVEIAVTGRTEDFENAHTLVMTLTMGGKSQDIAEIELMKTGSVIEVYMAELAAGGNAFLIENDQFVYSETPLEDGATIGLYDHWKNHLKVSANRNWKVTAPEWLTLSQEGGERGKIVAIDLASTDELRPFEDVENGKLAFFVDEDTPLATYLVRIEGCANEFSYSIVNAANAVLAADAGTTTGSITAAYGSQVFFAIPGDTEWIKFSSGQGFSDSNWSEEEKKAGLHTKSFTAEYEENTDAENTRKAYLFCLPLGEKTLSKEKALTADGNVSEDFRKYLIASYTQQRYVAPREPGKLLIQSMIGRDDNSAKGEELFALLQEYGAPSSYPTGEWYSDAIKDVPVLYKLTLKDLKYGESAILKIENQDDYKVYCHTEDMEGGKSTWIEAFGANSDGYYRFLFENDGEPDENGDITGDVTWTQPKHPQAYVIFKEEGAVTGALLLEIDAEELNIPLQNATANGNVDIGFTVLTPDNFGYNTKYSSVPQYKVHGYDSGQVDVLGPLAAGALTLVYSTEFGIDRTKFAYEAVEEGLLSGKLDWCEGKWVGGFSDGHMAYFDRTTGEEVEVSDYVFGSEEPRYTGGGTFNYFQMTYQFGSSGPDQFRILCYDAKNELVCTVYVYHYDKNDYDENE